MANTLTNLIPSVYEALDVVSRELVGFIPAVMLDANAERAAVNQSIYSHVAPASSAADITPDTNPPDTGDQTIGSVEVKITKARAVPFRWTGEEERGLSHGIGRNRIQIDQIAQAMRTLTNEVEADLAALHTAASRAYGLAATTPFASGVGDSAQVLKILVDNGTPGADLQLVVNTSAGAALRTLGQLSKANEAGSDSLLRQGVIGDLHGFAIRESAQIKTHTAGTGSSATTNTAGYAVGATTITLASAGTGTILAGDVITFANDANKYVVVTGDADVSGGGTVVLASPGLRQALPGSAVNITVVATSARNMAFHRGAMVLVARAPAIPSEGDSATDATIVTDPRSGLSFEVRLYKQYRRVKYELALAWGVKNVKTEHTAILLG